jgi:hypothetical protein
MTALKKTMVLVFFFAMAAVSARAQGTLNIKVASMPGDISEQVRELLLPMISANPHFTMVSDNSWDIDLIATCLAPTSGSDRSVMGVACAYSITYAPNKFAGFEYTLEPSSIDVGPDQNNVATAIFSDLLDFTTVDKIKSADTALDGLFDTFYKAAVSTVKDKPCVSPQKNGQSPKGR